MPFLGAAASPSMVGAETDAPVNSTVADDEAASFQIELELLFASRVGSSEESLF